MTTNAAALKRLDRLELALRLVGCSTCRDWTRVVYEDAAGRRGSPDHCPKCGRLVADTVVRVVYAGPEEEGRATD